MKWEEMTNNEILMEQINLKNKYQVLKKEILDKLTELDSLDEEYNKSVNELNKRGYNPVE